MAIDLTKINQINLKAKQVLTKPVYTPAPTPVIQPPKPQTPAPAPQPSTIQKIGSAIAQPIKNAGQKLFQALQYPSQKVEDFLTGGKGYEAQIEQSNRQRQEIAKQPGVMGTLARIPQPTDIVPTGVKAFTSRVVLDPLNLVPIIKPLEQVGKVSKAIGLTEKIAPVAEKVRTFISPFIKSARSVPSDVQYAMDLIPRKASMKSQKLIDWMAPLVKDMKTPEREAIAHLLEPKVASAQGIDLAAEYAKVGDTGRKLLGQFRKMGNKQITDLVEQGAMTGEKAKELLKSGDYFFHTGFEKPKNVLQRVFGEGVRAVQGYLKKRTGVSGYSLDAPLSVAERQVKQIYDTEKLDFLRGLTQNSEYAVKLAEGQKVPNGFVKLVGEATTPFGKGELVGRSPLKGYAIRKDIYDAIKGLDHQAETSVETALRKIHQLWKPSVTAWNPAFHAQNLIGNLHNSIVGGVRDPKRIAQIVAGGFNPEEKALLKRSGILNTGQVRESLMSEGIADLSKIKGKNVVSSIWESKLNPIKQWMNFWQGAGNTIENNARGAFYLDQYNKALDAGMTTEQAMQKAYQTTNKFLFDYLTGLTPAERRIRNFFPFYTWTRFNVPLQVENVVKQPGLYSIPGKVSRTIEPQKQGIPEERGFSFPTGMKDQTGNDIRYSPNLPLNSLFDVSTPKTTLSNMLTPAKNLVIAALNLMGNPAQEIGFGGPTGKPIITPGYTPRGNLEEIKDFLIRQFRPFRDISSSGKLPFPANIMRFFLGSTTIDNQQKKTLNDLYKSQNLRSTREKEAQMFLGKGMGKEASGVLRSIK